MLTLIKQSHFFWYTFFNWGKIALQFCVKLYTKLLVSAVQQESIIILHTWTRARTRTRAHTHTHTTLHLEPPFSPGISYNFTHIYTPLPLELPSSPPEWSHFLKYGRHHNSFYWDINQNRNLVFNIIPFKKIWLPVEYLIQLAYC